MRAVALAALVSGASGCQVTGVYTCTSDQACLSDGKQGYCEAAGHCSFDDTSCATQRRYDPSAGELANACVSGIVTGTVTSRYATNDTMFEPQVVEEPSTTVPTVILDDGSTPQVKTYSGGRFVFARRDDNQPYRITWGGTEYQHHAPHLTLVERSAGRPDRMPVSPMTQIRFDLTTNGNGESWVASTGLWSNTNTNTGSVNFNWSWENASSLSGTLGLLDASKNDRLYFTKVLQMNGISTLTEAASASITLADNTTTMFPAIPLEPVVGDQCSRVVAPLMDVGMKLSDAFGATQPTYAAWDLRAVPSAAKLTTAGGISLAYQEQQVFNANVDMVQQFGNPFPGTDLLAQAEAVRTRAFTFQGVGGVATYLAVVSAFFTPGCPGGTADTTSQLAYPGQVTVGTTLLTDDNLTPMIDRSAPVPISWVGSPGFYRVELDHVTTDGVTVTISAVQSYFTVAATVTIDPTLLVSGESYLVTIVASSGMSGALDGDFDTVTYPIANVQEMSYVFAIT